MYQEQLAWMGMEEGMGVDRLRDVHDDESGW